MDKLEEGKRVFNIEIEALKKTRNSLDKTFIKILDLITGCSGKIILTGIGKSGHIARKLAATFASLGTPSFFLHPAEALHGDLGMISENDVVIAISYSGESEEITRLLPNIKLIGAKIVTITGNEKSSLIKQSDITQILPAFNEACYLGLAPTSSTTTVLCYGDALAVVASSVYGFNNNDFGKYHPAGSLGKKIILKVKDLMVDGADIPIIEEGSLLTQAIVEIGKKGLGMVSIVDKEKNMLGLLTDGDIRRIIEKKLDVYSIDVDSVMTKKPRFVTSNILAIDALKLMKKESINGLPVLDSHNKIVGTLTLQMIIKAGIVL